MQAGRQPETAQRQPRGLVPPPRLYRRTEPNGGNPDRRPIPPRLRNSIQRRGRARQGTTAHARTHASTHDTDRARGDVRGRQAGRSTCTNQRGARIQSSRGPFRSLSFNLLPPLSSSSIRFNCTTIRPRSTRKLDKNQHVEGKLYRGLVIPSIRILASQRLSTIHSSPSGTFNIHRKLQL